MDRECVSLLPRVCEVLADSARSLPDDTSLEKLLDWFTELTKTGGSLLESCPCLLEFISTAVYNPTLDPVVLSFTLKLTGLVAASEDGFRMLQECSVLDLVFNLQRWKEAGLWDDPSIRIGWIRGLQSMLQNLKALSFFVQSGFIEPLLQLQKDTSLFVASAANQMLAHTMLFFQPPFSAGSNGISKKAEDDQRIDASSTAITMDTSAEYTAVVLAISKYFKESLVPSENAQQHQSLQLLKLLTLLLDQARPLLRETLLRSIGDSLEELVESDHSHLTLPLMDVILAAHSSSRADKPDKHITHLLSSMMDINKPAHLIHAAAAILRRGHHDTDHTRWAVNILLLPLNIITGQSLLGSSTAAVKHQFSTMEYLKHKTSCISMLCVSLANTPKITQMPADVLPCPPGVIVTAVLSLLGICSGYTSLSHTGCNVVFRNIIGSGKVQKCALETLTALSCCPDLLEVVKKRVCDMRWEVRDSTIEFLGKMAGLMKPAGEECDILGSPTCTTALLREALKDPESYVRASSISALAQTQANSWQQGAAVTQEQTEIVSQLLQILSQDTEGLARRAVIQYFIAWFSYSSTHPPPSLSTSSSSLLMNSVRSVLSLGIADLDWEVKFHTLKLAGLLLDETFSSHSSKSSDSNPALLHPYAVVSKQAYTLHTQTGTQTEVVESDFAGVLSNLVELGVISALLCGLVDCDRPVGLKACQLLITLRDTVCPLSLRALDATTAMATVAMVSCEVPGWGWGQEIKNTLAMKASDWDNKLSASAEKSFSGADEVDSEEEREHGARVGGDCVRVGVCEVLRGLDLDERLNVLTQSSDHVLNSPLSLLQDILTANATHAHPNTQPGKEVIVDCY
ncbi:BRCA1-associated ATM activator 1 BRCA1-associated protein required for ATM activation protein 1 [Channa argus]|uniref:BRCA1-associated ATM activator 1 BRCA1-associated protein required for ATM activation protein 1 n=1 Tax=Channa argus TaxID=215402 RepID=A0A6G1PCX6_CHAAH|nr:BRCA1-associated ATM activator 1 BRCA1-associated protein required for ATM activation protein 1 [Channa argus]